MEAFHIGIVADMGRAGDIGLRIAQDISANSALGYRTGLVHAGISSSSVRIHPEIVRRVREGKAEVIHPDWNVRISLLVVYLPVTGQPAFLKTLAVDRVLLVIDKLPDSDLTRAYEEFAGLFSSISLVATNSWLQSHLAAHYSSLPIESFEWRPSGHWRASCDRTTDQAGICVIATRDGIEGQTHHLLGGGEDSLRRTFLLDCSEPPIAAAREGLPQIRLGELSFERLMQCTDALLYFPPPSEVYHPDATIISALTAGKTVVLPQHLRPHFDERATYCSRAELPATVERLLGGLIRQDQKADGLSADGYVLRLRSLIGEAPQLHRARSEPSRAELPSALFFTTDCEDGQLTRLLAIARWIEPYCCPIFVTTGASAHVVESFGYTAECIAPQRYSLSSPDVWREWFKLEFEQLIDSYNAQLVVAGEHVACEALIELIGPRDDCKFVRVASEPSPEWVGCACSPFDLVVECADFGAPAKAPRPHTSSTTSVRTNPVIWLDPNELFSREKAARALRLDHRRPALLVRLCEKLKQTQVAADLAEQLRELDGVQIAILDDGNDPSGLLWPADVTRIWTYEIARYLNAFDVSVASPDYDAFYDAISHGLPTIFVNDGVEGKWTKRVKHAESAGAALELHPDKLRSLLAMIRVLLPRQANDFVRNNCRRLFRGNGSKDAADALRGLIS